MNIKNFKISRTVKQQYSELLIQNEEKLDDFKTWCFLNTNAVKISRSIKPL